MTNTPQSPDKETVEQIDEIENLLVNFLFSGLSIDQMKKLPKWLLINCENNKEEAKAQLQQLLIKERIKENKRRLHKDTCEIILGWSDVCEKKVNCVPIRKRITELENQLGEKS